MEDLERTVRELSRKIDDLRASSTPRNFLTISKPGQN